MATIARFIGVDRYAHREVSDLTGASRDATAMWALFADSIDDIQDELVLDSDATTDRVRTCLIDTLNTASEQDTVILFFAGHGTPEHQLVCHDTNPSDLAATSLPMAELAAAFKNSRAKAIVCLLDCCFSGGAPARVLSDAPVKRSTNQLPSFSGEGRYLITASADDEAAYEDPKSRHGLFTTALLSALQEASAGEDIGELIARVLVKIRGEAARLCLTQTPNMVGASAGGLQLPQLKAGQRFADAFPEHSGVSIDSNPASLTSFGIPKEVTDAWCELMPDGLNDLQVTAINRHRVLNGKSLLVVAPTSAGKTLIGEVCAAKAVGDNRKAVFLLPYKALVNEKFDQFTELYGERIGMRVVRSTGDFTDQTHEILHGKYDIALFTYEMFLNQAVANPSIMNLIGLVVVDEAQFVTDPNRGISVELLLTMLIAARKRGIEPQLVCLSAVIGNVNAFDQWLGCESLVSTERPVELIEGVIDRSGVFQYLDTDGQAKTEQLLSGHEIVQRRNKPSAQDVIVPLVRKLTNDGEKVIVFRNQKGNARGCAQYLARDLNFPPAQEALDQLPDGDMSSSSESLRECLAHGTAFHTSDLSREERSIVERTFREREGSVHALGATTTVAAGVNTPASTVIIAEQQFLGETGRPFTIAEYRNMAGRAGRLGFNEKGKSIILAESVFQREQLFSRYVQGSLEPLMSSFSVDEIDTWILRLLAQVPSVPRESVSELLANTYGGFLAGRDSSEWGDRAKNEIEKILARMTDLELIDTDGDQIKLSLLGRACGRSALTFKSSMQLVETVRSLESAQITPENLMVIVQSLPEAAPYTPLMKRGSKESIRPRQASQRFGPNIVGLLQRGAHDQWDYFGRCKRAAILGEWIDGVPVREIERTFSASPYQGNIGAGNVRAFADTTRLYLRAAAEIAVLVKVDSHLDPDQLDQLMIRLETGTPEDTVELAKATSNFDRGVILAIRDAGAKTLDACRQLGLAGLEKIVGTNNANRLSTALTLRKAVVVTEQESETVSTQRP